MADSNPNMHMTIAAEAVQAYHSGQHRLAADKYRESLFAFPDKWDVQRWHIFHGWISLLEEMYFQPSSADMDSLETIINDKSELKLFRAQASETKGFMMWWSKRDRFKAADYYREAVRLAEKEKKQERRRKVIATPDESSVSVGMVPVAELLDRITKSAKSRLDDLEKKTIYDLTPERLAAQLNGQSIGRPLTRSDGTPLPESGARQTRFRIGPFGTSLSKQEIEKLLSVGGSECDACGKTLSELGKPSMSCCGKCKRSFYCSAECQRDQWSRGHKHACRKPGQIKPGDYLLVEGLQNKPELNGEVVRVDGEDPNKPGERWAVRIPGGNRALSLSGKNLSQLRPLK